MPRLRTGMRFAPLVGHTPPHAHDARLGTNARTNGRRRLTIGACGAFLALAVAACDSSTAPPPVATVTVTPPPGLVIAGTSHQLAAVARDGKGNALSGRAIAWNTSSSAIATVTPGGMLAAVAPGQATITASSEGQSGTLAITVVPVPVASVVVAPGTTSVIAGTVIQLTASTLDGAGTALAGRALTWASSNTNIAEVSAAGIVTGVAPGPVTISATSEGKTGSADITVLPVPVANVTVTPASAALNVGETVLLTAVPRDANGVALSRQVVWTSANENAVRVSPDGLVTAVGPGCNVAVSATSEGKSGVALITVAGATNTPCIGAVTPATLTPGTPATITGFGFDPVAGNNVVTIAGVTATIFSATPTEIVVTVPCALAQNAAVRVTTNGAPSPAFTHPLAPAVHTLGAGESIVLTSGAASRCNQLAPAGATARYLVMAYSVAVSQNALANFELAGNPAPAGRDAVRVATAAPGTGLAEPGAGGEREAAHFAHMERERAIYASVRARGRAAFGDGVPQQQAAPLPALGDMRNLFYTFNLGCGATSQVIEGRAIYVGTRAIIWEDVANTLRSTENATLAGYYERLGQIFDTDQYDAVKNNFGDPLRRDQFTDGDGRIHMVFTQRLNGSGAAAYVTSCDQYPRTTFAGSNVGEFFYGTVPTVATLNTGSTNSPDGWFYFMGRTVVHEVKHIASLAARIFLNSPNFEQGWLEEGTARHAEEVWVRAALHKVPWKGNTGFGTAANNGILCDFHPNDPTCNALDPLRRPSYGMRRHFHEIRSKLLQPWNWSPFGDGTGQSGSVFYQTTWSLVRYAIDRYGASDAQFLTALTNSVTTGVTNLSAVAGASLDQLLGGWGLALYADDFPGMPLVNQDAQFQTWNLRSIYAGLNASPNWTSQYPTPFPIAPTPLGFGSFVAPLAGLRGGAHAYFEMSGQATAPQLLQLRGPNGAAPPADLRLAVIRLQ